MTTAFAAEDALPVTVVELGKVAAPVERDVEAELVSLNDAPVSAELSARVVEINAEVGDRVGTGDVLARLDCRDYEVALRQAKAGVSTVRARIAASEARVGAAESRVKAAESRVSAAESQVNAATSRVRAAVSQVSAANARVNAGAARVKAVTANMQSVGARINTAKSQVGTAQSQAAAAGARVPAAQAQFGLAQSQFQRNQQLRNQKLIAADLYEQARAGFDSAQSSLNAAKADANAAKAAIATANAAVSEAEGGFRAAQAEVETANADLAATRADVDINKANADIANAELESVRAQVATAQADADTARAEWEAAQADAQAAETELETALAQQEAAEVVVGRCEVTAPFSGQITARPFQLGQVAAPGAAAFRILQTEDAEVSARLAPDDIRDQEEGEALRFVAEGEALAVEQRAVVAQLDQATRTQEVRFRILDLHNLPVGLSGRLRWQGRLPALPPDWLLRRDGQLGLMLAVEGKAEFHPLPNAREGQPVLIDLPPETLLIDDNRLRVRTGQAIERVEP
ncbi:MAG: biotin/lipoyl-binding protein [Thiolinea sp.]